MVVWQSRYLWLAAALGYVHRPSLISATSQLSSSLPTSRCTRHKTGTSTLAFYRAPAQHAKSSSLSNKIDNNSAATETVATSQDAPRLGLRSGILASCPTEPAHSDAERRGVGFHGVNSWPPTVSNEDTCGGESVLWSSLFSIPSVYDRSSQDLREDLIKANVSNVLTITPIPGRRGADGGNDEMS